MFLADLCNKVLGQISDRGNQVAVAFMLGHDYGFKRIMSSYYFQDTDQVLNNQQKSCFKSLNMIVVLCRAHLVELLPHSQMLVATGGLVSTGCNFSL